MQADWASSLHTQSASGACRNTQNVQRTMELDYYRTESFDYQAGRLVLCHHSAITISTLYQHSIRQFTRQPTPARVNLLPLDWFTACLLVTGHFLLPLRGNVTMMVAIDSLEKAEPIPRSPRTNSFTSPPKVPRPFWEGEMAWQLPRVQTVYGRNVTEIAYLIQSVKST